MTGTVIVKTDESLIESILERGFDPTLPVGRAEFLHFIAAAEVVDAAGKHALPLNIGRLNDQFGETGRALMLPVAVGHRWLEHSLADGPIAFEESAIAETLVMLVRRLAPLLHQFVQFETIIARTARGIDKDRPAASDADVSLLDEWLQRWRTFPVLASLMTLTVFNWIRAVQEMLRAVERDHAAIATMLASPETPRVIRSLKGDAGDRHLGGRSVMILTFANDAKVVFKPKQLAVTDVFRALIDRINAAGYSTPLRVHRAIVADGQTWEEFIPHRACRDVAEVERFYHRMGGWIRLLQILEGRDFWLDNLIADGEYPMFIDLETIVQPRRGGMKMSAAGQVQDRLESSPIATNIVAMHVPIGPDVGSEELGCFATPREFLTPFAATDVTGVNTAGTSRSGYRTWTHPEHAPMLDGQCMPADLWFAAIEAGYREMAKTIDALASELLRTGGLVDALCEHPVRTIFRDTWTCNRIIHRSTAPPLLGSYRRRRQFLEQMDQNDSGIAEDTDRTRRVVAAEVRAIAGLDVPFFSAFGCSDAIYPPDDAPIPAFFDGAPRDRIARNLRESSRQRLEEDVAMLRTSFWTAHPQARAGARSESRPHIPIEAGGWQDAAERIAGDIAASRVTAPDGTSSWIALNYHPAADIDVWAPIGVDLMTGQSGLSVLFSDMFRVTGHPRWRALATDTARDVAEAIQQMVEGWRTNAIRPPASRVIPLVGAFVGIGGMLASVNYASELLEDPSLAEAWRASVELLDWESMMAAAPRDVITGVTGFGLSMTARQEWIDRLSSDVRERLVTIAHDETHVVDAVLPPGATAKLAGLPSERVGRLLLRSRLGIDEDIDLQRRISGIGSANPTLGELLGLIALGGPEAARWRPLRDMVVEAFDERQCSGSRLQEMDAAELALAMWQSTRDTSWLERAQVLGDRWISEFNSFGSWFPADLADDRFRLSVVWGLPAIASLLFRIGGAPTAASPRLLDWQTWEV